MAERTANHQEKAKTNPICCLLKELRNQFESSTGCCPKAINGLLSKLSLGDIDSKYIHFDPHQYTRILIAVNKHFSIILNCWSKGQQTPLHNHGNGTKICSWVHVLQGSFFVSHQDKDSSPRKITLKEGESIEITDEMGDHRAGNNSDSQNCISLHLYSPPYLECCFREKHGASCNCSVDKLKKFLPVIHCHDRQHYYTENEELETVALLKSRPIFSNFRKMVEVLRKEIVIEPDGIHSASNIKHIKDLLSCMNFNPKEWTQYAKFAKGRYTRNLIAYDEKFTILLLCWEKGQKSPIHDHSGSNCWVKVLDGEVEESLYDLAEDGLTTTLRSCRKFQPGAIAYINDSYGVHKMGNANEDRVAISLHVYSPAYHECFIFDENEATKKKVCISTAYGARYPFMERKIGDNPANPPQSMKSFIAELDTVFTSSDVDSNTINDVVNDLVYHEQQWENYIHFSPEQYTRNLLGFTDHYSAVLACWCPGQQTPIHEHGESDDRRVWIKVLAGTLQIQYFEETFNQMAPSTRAPVILKEGEYIMMHDNTLGQHRTFNASSTENCISLHIYSPPYVECSFVEQTGQKKLIPVAYCTKDINQFRAQLQEEDLELQYKFRSMVFSNFASFSNLINKYFEIGMSDVADDNLEVVKMLSHIHFHPKEWESRITPCESGGYTRCLVAFGYNYSVHLLCWKPGQKNIIHDHNESWSYFKVLEGNLSESIFAPVEEGKPMKVVSTKKLKNSDVVRHKPGVIHQVANQDPVKIAYSLHIYSPPLKQCSAYQVDSGAKTLYNCNHHLTPALNDLSI
mmetsp:Transcript_127985/g.190673  ORF Transcript_127985/g.190673 Transcript_127985/m.190673 type:complete len:799 (-) Transcript_127985:48-2444(-)